MLVNFVVLLSVLLGLCALALDGGLLEWRRIQLQNAADAAALSAAYEMAHNQTDYQIVAAGEAQQNGFTNGTNGVTVTALNPPTSGVYANNKTAVQVKVSQTVSSIFTAGSRTITAAATGVIAPCVYLMNTTSNPTTAFVTNSSHYTMNCAVYIGYNLNSASSTYGYVNALYFGGPASASSINGSEPAGDGVIPVQFNVPAMSDPLGYVATPAANPSQADCTYTTAQSYSGTATVQPGVYCGGLNITGGNITFAPGLYVVTGGMSWKNAASITGNSVSFYLTQGYGGSFGQFLLSSCNNVTLTASNVPISASYGQAAAGMLIFGDRNWVQTSQQDLQFSNTTLSLDGILYLTKTGISFVGGTYTSPNYFGLVVNNFYESGATVVINGNYSGVSGGNPYRPGVGLAE